MDGLVRAACYNSGMNSVSTSLATALALAITLACANAGGDTISLTIVTEQGVQITAPQRWLQRLAEAGVTNVRIRGASRGDQTGIEERETRLGKSYRVTGVLTTRERLRVPGAEFGMGDLAKLRDYLDRVLADGAEAVTAPRGNFGLTKRQFEDAFKRLGRPITFDTQGMKLAALVARVGAASGMETSVAPRAAAVLDRLECRNELRGLSLGCGLAIALKAEGYAAAPEKPRGEPVRVRVGLASDLKESWPIGWPNEASPSETAPVMFERINVEIDGYTLAEAVGAIAPRIEMPVYWDHAALAERRINPAEVQVKLARTRTYYKRILDKLLFQARLKGEVRVDEAGTTFFWITR